MVCKNCGNQLPDESKFCHYCGVQQTVTVSAGSGPGPVQPGPTTVTGDDSLTIAPAAGTGPAYSGIPYQQYMEEQKQFAQQRLAEEEAQTKRNVAKKKQQRTIGIIAGAVGFAAIVIILSIVWIYPAIKYQSAVSSMNKGIYNKAAVYFESLGDYKDSEDLAVECHYQYACQLLGEGEYAQAKELFLETEPYSDSEENITACDYGIAKDYIDSEEYESAIKLLTSLGTYEDSAKLLVSCYASYGDQLYKEKEYKDAYDAYQSGNVTVSDNKNLVDCYYQLMLSDIDAKDWEAAYDKWSTIKDLRNLGDASAKVLENYIALLASDGTKEAYEEAQALIASLDSRYVTTAITSLSTQCTSALNELLYQEAISYYNNGDYDSAVSAFGAILGYKDASDYYNELTKWTVSVIINNSEYDSSTDLSSASKYDTIYAHVFVYSGDPNAGINIYVEWQFSDGDSLNDTFDAPMYSGDQNWTSWWYNTPESVGGCTATIYVYNLDTSQLLCTDTIIVS